VSVDGLSPIEACFTHEGNAEQCTDDDSL